MVSEVCTEANWCSFSVRAASDLSGSGIFRQQGRCAYQQQADFFAVPDPGDTICPGCLQPYADFLLHRLEYAQCRRNALGYPLLLRNKGGPSGTGSLLTEKGQELLSAYAQFESAAKENMEKLYDSYLRDIL